MTSKNHPRYFRDYSSVGKCTCTRWKVVDTIERQRYDDMIWYDTERLGRKTDIYNKKRLYSNIEKDGNKDGHEWGKKMRQRKRMFEGTFTGAESDVSLQYNVGMTTRIKKILLSIHPRTIHPPFLFFFFSLTSTFTSPFLSLSLTIFPFLTQYLLFPFFTPSYRLRLVQRREKRGLKQKKNHVIYCGTRLL